MLSSMSFSTTTMLVMDLDNQTWLPGRQTSTPRLNYMIMILSIASVTSEQYVNEELYWNPAHHEDDIKEQLTKLKVENVLNDSIE